ncbi:MAG: hypothetical protein NTW16_19625 [Bacteroidetes bacterium]|nr:hypothetical protein [Bacteroidota bacterium]
MKTYILIPMFVLQICHATLAQTDPPEKKATYHTWIKTYEGRAPVTGALYEVNDSSITISTISPTRIGSSAKIDMSKIDARSIDVIKIRNEKSTHMGILIGAITGLAVGAAIEITLAMVWPIRYRSHLPILP